MSSCQGCTVLGQSGNAAVLPFFNNMQNVNSTTQTTTIAAGDTAYFASDRKNYLATGLNLIQLNKMMDANALKTELTKRFQADGNQYLECVWVRISGIRDGNAVFNYGVEYAIANTAPAAVGGSGEITFIQPRSVIVTVAIIIASILITWQFWVGLAILIAIIIFALAIKKWLFGDGTGSSSGGLLGGLNIPTWAGSALTVGVILVLVLGGILLLVGISGIGLNISKKGVSTTASNRKLRGKSKYGSVEI